MIQVITNEKVLLFSLNAVSLEYDLMYNSSKTNI